jgi:hypothetical protein
LSLFCPFILHFSIFPDRVPRYIRIAGFRDFSFPAQSLLVDKIIMQTIPRVDLE